MDNMTQIPIGTKFKIKKSGEIGTLDEIRNYPTRYKIVHESGNTVYYRTHEVEMIESNEQNEA
tara:strand:+ start:428 stop:616 length:189 start_codon:yes stop_codon:yes gene_type:complete